jgi:hypothetical protein
VLLPVSLLRLPLLLLHLPCNAQTNGSKSSPTNNGNPAHHVLGASPQPKTNNKTKWTPEGKRKEQIWPSRSRLGSPTSLTVDRNSSDGGGVHHGKSIRRSFVGSFFRSSVGNSEPSYNEGGRVRRVTRLRPLDGEAGAGEAPGAAVARAAARLHPQPDRGEVGGG